MPDKILKNGQIVHTSIQNIQVFYGLSTIVYIDIRGFTTYIKKYAGSKTT